MSASFFLAAAVIAVAWAIFLGALLLRSARSHAWPWVGVWTGLLVPVVVLLMDLTRDRSRVILGGVVGWAWGLAYAWFVRRRLRPMGARERDVPIEGWCEPWDLARLAFGIALAAPLLGPITAGLLVAPFD